MSFLPIEITEARPYVRFVLKNSQCIHSLPVLPYEHRFILCLSGTAVFLLGQERAELHENDVLYIAAAQPYQCIQCSADCSVVYYYFDLTMQHKDYHIRQKPMPAGSFEKSNLICCRQLQQNGRPLNYLAVKNAYDSAKYLKKILEHVHPAVSNPLQDSLLSGYAILALTHLLKSRNKTAKSRATRELADFTMQYIHKHYAEPLDLESVAQAVRFHKSYINRAMREHTGLSVHQYILRYRLEKAMQLLSSAPVTVGSAAEQCGFHDPKYFATVFKRCYGVSPSKITVWDSL